MCIEYQCKDPYWSVHAVWILRMGGGRTHHTTYSKYTMLGLHLSYAMCIITALNHMSIARPRAQQSLVKSLLFVLEHAPRKILWELKGQQDICHDYHDSSSTLVP